MNIPPRSTHCADAQHACSATAVAVHRIVVSHRWVCACGKMGILTQLPCAEAGGAHAHKHASHKSMSLACGAQHDDKSVSMQCK
eukprot:3486992-Pleurochrysis_carterae.AAC.1